LKKTRGGDARAVNAKRPHRIRGKAAAKEASPALKKCAKRAPPYLKKGKNGKGNPTRTHDRKYRRGKKSGKGGEVA